MISKCINDLKKEFCKYSFSFFLKDVMAGLIVSAVALPLALAFAIGSGVDAESGLITAILSGIVIGMFSGASYQISGPTGAMAAILIGLIGKYGINGIFISTFLAGIILLFLSLFKCGKIVSIIPGPVITGFTSGIAIIIALGQIDNFLGIHQDINNFFYKIYYYIVHFNELNYNAIFLGSLVCFIMIFWPKKLGVKFPASLFAIIVSLVFVKIFNLKVETIGEIPKSLIATNRLKFSDISFVSVSNFIIPSFSIAILAMIESLLCGASAEKMKEEKFFPNKELFAQGLGNILLPFFGGIPATAAIARTSVAIKSGQVTRLTSIFHSIFLIFSIFFLSPFMSKIPLSCLAGILIITAFRMNDWKSIKFIFKKKFKTAIFQFLITMFATVIFDLSIAIVIGIIFSFVLFIINISDVDIDIKSIDLSILKDNRILQKEKHLKTHIFYITGPVFFTVLDKLREKIKEEIIKLDNVEIIIFSMRGVPQIDVSGVDLFFEIHKDLSKKGITILFSGLNSNVKKMFKRSGFVDFLGEQFFFFNAKEALENI